MVMCVGPLAASAGVREAVELEEPVPITADGFGQLSSCPMEESRPWSNQPRERSRLTSSDSGPPAPFISLATRCPL